MPYINAQAYFLKGTLYNFRVKAMLVPASSPNIHKTIIPVHVREEENNKQGNKPKQPIQ